jgi:hypothetical protein
MVQVEVAVPVDFLDQMVQQVHLAHHVQQAPQDLLVQVAQAEWLVHLA